MKAAVCYEIQKPMVIDDVELDDPKAGEVLVKVGAAGICRSDRHFMHGDANIALPAVLGHEGAGTVERVGPGVTSVSPGQQVIFSFVPACGRCKTCLDGRSHLCDNHMISGPFMYDGTTRLHKGDQRIHHMGKVACFAEHAVVPETGVVPVASPIPMDKAAMIGCCVMTGVGAVIFNAKVAAGSTVAVVGCGGVGVNVIMGARLVNASKIIAIDISESQLEFAMQFGATHTINARDQDPVAQVKALTGGAGRGLHFRGIGVSRDRQGRLRYVRQERHGDHGGHCPHRRGGVSEPGGSGADGEDGAGLLLRLRRAHRHAHYGGPVPGGQVEPGRPGGAALQPGRDQRGLRRHGQG